MHARMHAEGQPAGPRLPVVLYQPRASLARCAPATRPVMLVALRRRSQAEVERLLFEDPDPDTGFMLHPDLKWVRASLPAQQHKVQAPRLTCVGAQGCECHLA